MAEVAVLAGAGAVLLGQLPAACWLQPRADLDLAEASISGLGGRYSQGAMVKAITRYEMAGQRVAQITGTARRVARRRHRSVTGVRQVCRRQAHGGGIGQGQRMEHRLVGGSWQVGQADGGGVGLARSPRRLAVPRANASWGSRAMTGTETKVLEMALTVTSTPALYERQGPWGFDRARRPPTIWVSTCRSSRPHRQASATFTTEPSTADRCSESVVVSRHQHQCGLS